MATRAGAALAVVLILSACGGGTVGLATRPPATPVFLDYDHSAGVTVVEADTYGGLTPPLYGRHVPEVRIYGDGLVVLAREDGALRAGVDRAITTGHIDEEELVQLLGAIAVSGFFDLDDRYLPSPALPDLPWRYVAVNLLGVSKTVSIYPFDHADAPAAFWETYRRLTSVQPSDSMVFTPTSGTMTATDLGPIDDLSAGRRNQVAPWDTPLVGILLAETAEGAHLEEEQYQVVEEFLIRYPPGQLFGSQEGRVYQVLLEASLPWEEGSP